MPNHVSYESNLMTPSKIVCVGRNYVAHIQELNNDMPGELVLFMKPNSAISEQLIAPSQRCRFETEICFLVKGGTFAAVGVGFDLTLVDVQKRLKEKRLPWEKSKAFNASATFSHFVSCPETLDQLVVQLDVDGARQQYGGTELMIYKPDEILRQVKELFTLEDGDIVMTGTPKGVDDIKAGSTYEVTLFNGEEVLVTQRWEAAAAST